MGLYYGASKAISTIRGGGWGSEKSTLGIRRQANENVYRELAQDVGATQTILMVSRLANVMQCLEFRLERKSACNGSTAGALQDRKSNPSPAIHQQHNTYIVQVENIENHA
jgi:hypothetical protein